MVNQTNQKIKFFDHQVIIQLNGKITGIRSSQALSRSFLSKVTNPAMLHSLFSSTP